MTSVATSETGDWSSLEARLLSRFSQLHPEAVRRCLRDSMTQFEGARVRTYLAVLIERAATDRLRVLERADSHGATEAPGHNVVCLSTKSVRRRDELRTPVRRVSDRAPA